jgi:nucleotide-binding universal stress UspA family protein
VFKHLLVPLDGSRLAETALPAAAFLAGLFRSTVTLVHLIEHNAPPAIHSDRHLTDPAEAQAYLAEVARRAFPAGVPVERHVHTTEVSDVARGLVEHAAELGADLIAMCTHGRGGLRGWLFGSIAQQVVGLGAAPVLLVRPTESGNAPPFACRMILVPLDGNPDHEAGLPVAAELAKAGGGAVYLVMVIRSLGNLKGEMVATAMLMPLATNALLELGEKEAEAYLHRQTTWLRAAGVAVTAEVARGDPAPYLLNAAQHVGADLIVLGTHGKSGLQAFWSGSVAPKLSGRSHAPLLLVPLAEPGKADRLPGSERS